MINFQLVGLCCMPVLSLVLKPSAFGTRTEALLPFCRALRLRVRSRHDRWPDQDGDSDIHLWYIVILALVVPVLYS